MIVVDTSIWIEFFRGRSPYFEYLLHLLEHQEVYAIELVFAELLQGAKSDREREKILSYWRSLPKLEFAELCIESGLRSGLHDWSNKGISLIDSIIITHARKSQTSLWTLDKKLHKVMKKSEIYEPVL
jgi:predicted nucleic acid-binding protein